MKGKKSLLVILLAAILLLVPMAVYGQGDTGGPAPTPGTDPMNASAPPIEQPLVPEGVLAMQLVEALKIGKAQDEAQAESMLSAVDIEPKNGWIAGYPVTPPVISEIEKNVGAAADAGKLPLKKDQALKVVGDLKAKLGLNISTGTTPQAMAQTVPSQTGNTVIYKFTDKNGVIHYTDRYESIPKEYRNQVQMVRETTQSETSVRSIPEETANQESPYPANLPPEVINDYYNDGPPVVTYYAPPQPYYYLYSWVPYPFWYSSFYFPGYFILRDFHRRVYWNNRPYAVTNYVGAAFGGRGGTIPPTYRAVGGSGISTYVGSAKDFHSPSIQASARQIAGMSQNRAAGSGAGKSAVGPMASMNRPVSPPGGNGRSFAAAPRASSAPSYNSSRSYAASAAPQVFSSPPSFPSSRSFSTPAFGGGGSFGGSHGGGSSAGFHGGAGSSGGTRGHGGGRR